LAVKLRYAETDQIVTYIESKIQPDPLAWMQGDLQYLKDVRPCLKYIETHIYDKGRADGYQIKVQEISKKISSAFGRFNFKEQTPDVVVDLPEPVQGWQEYTHYLPKHKSDVHDFYSHNMMRLLQSFQKYFGEPTCHEIVASFHKLERKLIFN
jgi:hypothetical protein